jgi:uncharacterized protein (DUF433 family)
MKIAFTPVIYEHAARFVGRTPWEVSRDADLMFEGHRRAYLEYHHQVIAVGIDIYNLETEAYGAKVEGAKSSARAIGETRKPPFPVFTARRNRPARLRVSGGFRLPDGNERPERDRSRSALLQHSAARRPVGPPIVEGTRIGVHDVVAMVKTGASVDEVVASFPRMTRAQVYGCLAYFEDHLDEIEPLVITQTEHLNAWNSCSTRMKPSKWSRCWQPACCAWR